jgi:hypothetical protein
MLTLARLNELATLNDPKQTGDALREYGDSLAEHDRRNLVAMAELKPAADLLKMSADAPQEEEAVFVRVAAIIRHAHDSLDELRKAAETMDVAAIMSRLVEVAEAIPTMPEATVTPYELPVFSLVGDQPVYETVAKLQKGRALKSTVTSGWMVPGVRPAENHYVPDDVVERMLAQSLIVPGVGSKPGAVKEYNLSVIGWRCMGCLYTDRTAYHELRTYELIGTDKDNPTAARFRSISADWRARQARKDTTPGWNRYTEFDLTISDKVTGNGVKTVTVIFDSGDGATPDAWEFYGDCLNASGYFGTTTNKGRGVGKTVSQLAFDFATAEAAKYAKTRVNDEKAEAARKKLAAKPVKEPKPPKPKLVVIEEGEDADALARELGLL